MLRTSCELNRRLKCPNLRDWKALSRVAARLVNPAPGGTANKTLGTRIPFANRETLSYVMRRIAVLFLAQDIGPSAARRFANRKTLFCAVPLATFTDLSDINNKSQPCKSIV